MKKVFYSYNNNNSNNMKEYTNKFCHIEFLIKLNYYYYYCFFFGGKGKRGFQTSFSNIDGKFTE